MMECVSCCLKLIPLRGKNIFEPRPSNETLVNVGCFSKFPTSTPVILVWESPTPRVEALTFADWVILNRFRS